MPDNPPSDGFAEAIRRLRGHPPQDQDAPPSESPNVANASPPSARGQLQRGLDAVADAVRPTLGPGASAVMIATGDGIRLLDDGLSVAQQVELDDPFERMGAQLVTQAARKTNTLVGDGTTACILLAQAMVDEAIHQVGAGASAAGIKQGIEDGVHQLVEAIESQRATASPQQLREVALSAAMDRTIGDLVAETADKVGRDGVVTAEESLRRDFEVEFVEGVQLDGGFVAPSFITDPDRSEALIENPYILISSERLLTVAQLLPALEAVVKVGEIVVVAPDVDGEALGTLVVNKQHGTFNSLAVKVSGRADERAPILQDLAILTGARVLGEVDLASVTLRDFGRARRVRANDAATVFVECGGSAAGIVARIKEIKSLLDTSTDLDRAQLRTRLARMAAGVAVIRVGAPTEAERQKRIYKVRRALSALRTAFDDGVVPGGGVAFLSALAALDRVQLNPMAKPVIDVFRTALAAPFGQLAANAGRDPSEVPGKTSVVDPTMVPCTALRNAADVAVAILGSGALVDGRKPQAALGAADPSVARNP